VKRSSRFSLLYQTVIPSAREKHQNRRKAGSKDSSMSAHALRFGPAFHLEGFLRPLSRLCGAVARQSILSKDLDKLSDHLLVDIGVDPRAVSHSARDAADALQLLQCGWQGSSRRQWP
jgi:hypothetical protein